MLAANISDGLSACGSLRRAADGHFLIEKLKARNTLLSPTRGNIRPQRIFQIFWLQRITDVSVKSIY